MSSVFEFQDEGSLAIKVGETEVVVDVMEASEKFSRAVREADNDEAVYAEKLREAVMSLGFPSLSHYGNHAIAEKVWERSRELKKKLDSMKPQDSEAESPTITTSTRIS